MPRRTSRPNKASSYPGGVLPHVAREAQKEKPAQPQPASTGTGDYIVTIAKGEALDDSGCIKEVTGSVTLRADPRTKVAEFNGSFIKRTKTRYGEEFLDLMDEVSAELAEFGFEHFHGNGRLLPSLKRDVWGSSLDQGDFIVIEYCEMAPKYCGKGNEAVKLEILTALSTALEAKCVAWRAAFVAGHLFPMNYCKLRDVSAKKVDGTAFHNNVLFPLARRFGFRRLGLQGWVAMVPDRTHPCWDTAAPDPPLADAPTTNTANYMSPLCDFGSIQARMAAGGVQSLSGSPTVTMGLATATERKCSCGKCLGGVLSPRTLYAIAVTADLQGDQMIDDIDAFPSGRAEPLHEAVYTAGMIFGYVSNPPPKVYKSYVVGLRNACQAIAMVCRGQGIPSGASTRPYPSASYIDTVAATIAPPPNEYDFFARRHGGKVEDVLNGLMSLADDFFTDGVICEEDEEFDALPECDLDIHWPVVADALYDRGYRPPRGCSPAIRAAMGIK